MVCAACSLFWPFVYGYYIHYFHEWQTADAIQKKLEIEAKEYHTLAQGTHSLQTRAPVSRSEIEDFRSNRLEAAGIYEKKAKTAKRRETRYIHLWQWLGRIAQASFLIGLGFLLAFAIKNL
jgi:high-affinity Fe2+/Pb2+ permease